MKDHIEFPINPEPRCPCLLLLDTSYSMTTAGVNGVPIEELNKGIALFERELKKDKLGSKRVEIGVITFGGTVNMVQEFETADRFTAPTLVANGDTPMGEASEFALDVIRRRQKYYKSNKLNSYKPWIFIISDGFPTDLNWENKAETMKRKAQKDLLVWPVGVGGADLKALSRFSDKPPKALKDLCFTELFRWVSSSLSQVSSSSPGEQIHLEKTTNWETISV